MQTDPTKTNGAAVMDAPPSLLDSIIERQAEKQADIASRYKPVMSIDEAVQRHRALAQFIREILVEGEDYGKIPGTDTKPVLLKPGAEKLCAFFGYAPVYTVTDIEDWMGHRFGEPLFYYRYTCTLMKDGAPVGSGEGSANTWESKYRWRWVTESALPADVDRSKMATRGGAVMEFDFAIEKGETGGQYGKPAEYWAKWRKAIESGVARAVEKTSKTGKKLKAWEMDGTLYRVPNADFADVINTTQKMGQKRAYIAATLSATGASQYFTQDLEDIPMPEAPPVRELPPPPPPTEPRREPPPPPREVGSVADIKQQATKVDTGGAPIGTQAAADNVAQRKLAEMQQAKQAEQEQVPPPAAKPPVNKLPTGFADIMKRFEEMKSILGDEIYYNVLGEFGVKHANQLGKLKNFQACYDRMIAFAKGQAA